MYGIKPQHITCFWEFLIWWHSDNESNSSCSILSKLLITETTFNDLISQLMTKAFPTLTEGFPDAASSTICALRASKSNRVLCTSLGSHHVSSAVQQRPEFWTWCQVSTLDGTWLVGSVCVQGPTSGDLKYSEQHLLTSGLVKEL